jgi:hypothetical protein
MNSALPGLAALCFTLSPLALQDCAQAQEGTGKPPSPAAQDEAAAVRAPGGDRLLNAWLRDQSPSWNSWDIGGHVRVQYDAKQNAGSFPDSVPDRDFIRMGQDNDNDFWLFREKVHVGYTHDWFTGFAEVRDSWTSGDDRDPSPFTDRLDLHQAYVRFEDFHTFPLSLKVGRQQFSYGDERLVEIADWNNLERVFDAVKARCEVPGFWVDGFASHYVIPDDEHFNVPNSHDLFCGVYASARAVPWQDTDLYFFSRNVDAASANVVNTAGTGPGKRDVYTVGLRMKSLPGKLAGWDYGTEIAGQWGRVTQGGQDLKHEAYVVDVMGGYTWTDAAGSPRLGFDFVFGSGDHDPNDGRHETFELLFGAAHKFYGIMDVTGVRNTRNPSVNLTVKPLEKLTIRTDYLMFWLADTNDLSYAEIGKGRTANGYGIHPGFDSYFGSEIDLVATYAPTPCASVQAGYSHFFVGDYVRQSVDSVAANGGAVDADYFYMMVTFNF